MYVLLIVVCPFVIFLLAIVLYFARKLRFPVKKTGYLIAEYRVSRLDNLESHVEITMFDWNMWFSVLNCNFLIEIWFSVL